jgi:rhodanese-related sulfurtransferase
MWWTGSRAMKRRDVTPWSGWTRWIGVALVLCGLLPNLSARQDLEAVKKKVRTQFPPVRQLSTAELAAWLGRTNGPPPMLLDARSPAEYAVSHLPGARLADAKAPVAQLLSGLGTNQAIVVYCSVGYRSSRLVERLQQAGHTNAFNLDGSIFQWANEDRLLERDGQPVSQVHPYNTTFGRLLRPEHRAAATPVKE